MRSFVIVCAALLAMAASDARAGMGGGTQPKSSWDQMQTLEYNIGRIAGGLDLCRRYSLSQGMQSIAKLSPYGNLGMDKMRAFDAIRGGGCTSMAREAEKLLGDKDKLLDYLKAKYDCSEGNCVER